MGDMDAVDLKDVVQQFKDIFSGAEVMISCRLPLGHMDGRTAGKYTSGWSGLSNINVVWKS